MSFEVGMADEGKVPAQILAVLTEMRNQQERMLATLRSLLELQQAQAPVKSPFKS